VRIARQSIWTGLGLSVAAMLVAAAGYIPPPVGALLQEAIDVAVILNALRTSRHPRDGAAPPVAPPAEGPQPPALRVEPAPVPVGSANAVTAAVR
jgi:hypothetical protein